jgi:hypothetical protein
MDKRVENLKMHGGQSERLIVWRGILCAVMLALVVATTVGPSLHQHANCSPDGCPICLVTHQTIEPPQPGIPTHVLVPSGRGPEPLPLEAIYRFFAPQLPVRAPPAA